MDVDEQLQREAAGRRLAAFAALGAVALQVVSQVLARALVENTPDLASPGGLLAAPGFVRDNAAVLIGAQVLAAVGFLLCALALDHLYLATRFRRPETPKVTRVLTYAGPALLALGLVVPQVIVTVASIRFLERDPGNYFAAREIFASPLVYWGQEGAQRAGELGLAIAIVLVSMNAMRVGLLTRFMGVLGVIVGVLLLFPPQLAPGPVILWFWLGALAYLFLGRWPGGVPLAWRTGRAEPWPSAAELREQRQRERDEDQAGEEERPRAASPGPGSEESASERRPHPSSRKRKGRKRR